MFGDLQVVIPSRSRQHKQITLFNLAKELWPYITIVVPEEQVDDYRAAVPKEVFVMPCKERGLSLTRKFVLLSKKTGKLITLDDDLTFYKRTDDSKFVRITENTIGLTVVMIEAIVEFLNSYPYVGLVDKFMSHTQPRGFKECSRFNEVYGYNRDLFPDPWPQIRVPHDEDHDFHLQLLTRGHKTAVITEYSKTNLRVNAPGGCSEWRSKEVMDETYRLMLQYWPGIVSLTNKPSAFSDVRLRYNWQGARKMGGI
jgi:hypothetical protein